MKSVLNISVFISLAGLPVCLSGCSDDTSHLFTSLDEDRTGLHFKNILQENETANVLNYAYFYNGGGVAIGDINNDGLPDILFTGNMVPNRLFLNKGNFTFEDITEKSGIAKKQGWCTGATMVDINGDGKLDIYICRSGDIDPARRKNLLYINNGVSPAGSGKKGESGKEEGVVTFTERAEEYGLADEGYSTQAAFFDYDKDGDLDMLLINHSLQQYANGAFDNSALRNQKDPAFASKLYRNDNGHFTDVSEASGISSNVLSFGLGVAISDINNDGWPDIYISNDFNEPDHLYINNGPGEVIFTEKLRDCMDQVSLYSMGSDFADYNNDGFPDLMTLDMLAEDNHTQKMHSGAENFDKFQLLFRQGFYYQYSRNMLQKNNGDGTFSEVGQLAGVSNTDWSWSALFCDFDNDGYKDLFITNGYARDFTDMDFIRYHVASMHPGNNRPAAKELLDKLHPLEPQKYIYRNEHGQTFTKKTQEWGLNGNTISSGAAYGDLDNDGAMDLVLSNINKPAGLYKNNSAKLNAGNHYLKIRLEGSPMNTGGIGTKVKLYAKGNQFYQEQMPVRGFQSSVDPVLNFGVGTAEIIDSIRIIWPDDRTQKLESVRSRQTLVIKWKEADQHWDYRNKTPDSTYFREGKAPTFRHREKEGNDFAVQPLLPNYISRQGPCMARADIDGDGRTDLYIGGAKGQPGQLFIQKADGSWVNKPEPAIARDSASEAVSAVFFDANADGHPDLYIASGGYACAEQDSSLQDHLYLNDGKGNFRKSPFLLPNLRFSKGCVREADINGDGYVDIFVGGRVVPGKYPEAPESRILLNDGKGRFRDATSEILPPGLQKMGMVTDAVWIDLNRDHWADLVVVGEWMPVKVFINEKGKLRDASAQYIKFASTGWWNTILAEDMDGDGDTDLVIGNTGLNTQFHASEKEPVSLYYKDFDGNGIVDPVLCYFIGGVSYPAVSRDDLVGQIPMLKKKFLEYNAYADATISDIFTAEQLKDAGLLKAACMETVYLENRGKEGFVRKTLPPEAQYAPVYAIGTADADHDGNKDLILTGNNSWTRIRFGRYKANHGVVLKGDGKGQFSYVPQWKSGLSLRDDVRSLQVIPPALPGGPGGGQGRLPGERYIFGINNGAVREYIKE
ncbi:VCBS repeat-containing protein [Flavitalea flava]